MTTTVSRNGAARAAESQNRLTIPPIEVQVMELTLIGDSPLICHRWDDKAKRLMLEKQTKAAKTAKAAKDPHADFLASLYPHPDGGWGFPTVAFKAAAVGACRFTDGVRMTEARGAFHLLGELAPITGEPRIREDMVRVGMGTADIRYRGEFPAWSTRLLIRFNAHALSPAQIVNLFNVAGFGVGVGEWRPERDGSYGMFHVGTETEVGE